MSREGYIAIAIAIIVFLLGVFFVSFILYRKTPVPQGCEDLKTDAEKCAACGESECPIYKSIERRDGK